MAVSMQQLRDFSKQLELKAKELDFQGTPTLAIDVPTRTPNGEQELTVLVRSYQDGEMFEAVMVQFLPTELHQKSEYKTQFLFYLLHKAWNTKCGTPEVDKDGEVRLLIEIPLIDATMTVKQFAHILHLITQTAVDIAIEGSQVLTNGEIKGEDSADRESQMQEAMMEMIRMLNSAGGREKLKQIANDDEYPEKIRQMANTLLLASAQTPDAL